ncbi:MAG: efflux RND transporter periplasmic adaptor subunit [Candidatus Edwardsbacteria bacterium]|nr:efflux RND transporter periplasmic adaptor subunit [Candidatus Edwardsbacteria bacterium]MBU1575788.1 efflux RND transporter periplasmic adaptor subunit [Candidatus Edwardsbacteria bacterium]MBU2463995.1 efflux RND transporter periplasmic adaptor subunit [Candidatus Edwardsbacteria bacterium]MBU2593249.1 efflux RND transporter periplasmic adaptor subunit [Candidatus Edwardsbacteria bacterium]
MKRYLTMIAILPLLLVSCGNNNGKRERIEATGTIEAIQVNVSAKMGGQIKGLLGKEGAAVRVGDTLATMDHEMLDLQLRQSRAGLELARIQYENDRKDDQRTSELFQKGSVTQKQRDDVNAKFRASGARLEQARTAADMIRKNISDCYVTAPLAGMITNSTYEIGETAGPGSILFTISKMDTVELVVYVNEKELGYVKLGQRSEIRIDSFKDKAFMGLVVYISPQAEFTPKNIQTKQDRVKQVFGVKLKIPNPEQQLKAGIPADATIFIKGQQ